MRGAADGKKLERGAIRAMISSSLAAFFWPNEIELIELIGYHFIDFLKKSGSATGLPQRIDRKRTVISC